VREYVRPLLPVRVFRDASGNVIDYGNRWRDQPGRQPPEDTYSVNTNTERFAPLHAVADALVDHLTHAFAVTPVDGVAAAEDLMHAQDDAVRAVRLVPANSDAASLTFVFTSYPGVVVHAGVLHDFAFPQCGCDACDETAESAAEDLERLVLTVATGGYTEFVEAGGDLGVGYELVSAGGSRRHRSRADSYPPGRLRDAEARLRALPQPWQPWVQRQ
jgi:hypothetical protein